MWREGLFLLETIPYPLTVGVYTCSVSARLKLRCQRGPQGVGLQERERERKTFKLPHAILYSRGDRHGGLCFDKGTMSYVWMLIKMQSELPDIFSLACLPLFALSFSHHGHLVCTLASCLTFCFLQDWAFSTASNATGYDWVERGKVTITQQSRFFSQH